MGFSESGHDGEPKPKPVDLAVESGVGPPELTEDFSLLGGIEPATAVLYL